MCAPGLGTALETSARPPSALGIDTSGATEVCSLGLATLEVVPLCATYRHKSKFLKTLIETTANILKKNLL